MALVADTALNHHSLTHSLFKSCVWKARNEVKKERKTRTPGDLRNSFLGLLGFRGKVDLSRFTEERFKRFWVINNSVFEKRNASFVFVAHRR